MGGIIRTDDNVFTKTFECIFYGLVRYSDCLKTLMPIQVLTAGKDGGLAFFRLSYNCEKGNRAMAKTLDTSNDVVRSDKHPFRKTDSHPKKALKNRYERRKIKEFIQLTDWLSEEAI